MDLGEQIKHPLRRSFLKLKSEHPAVSDEMLFEVSVKSQNNSIGLNGLFPIVLVFGAFPRLSVRTDAEDIPSNTACARMRRTAMAEFSKAIDEVCLVATEKCQARRAPDFLFTGDHVLAWYKKSKKWEGPYSLLSSFPHVFYVKSDKNRSAQLHVREFVRPYAACVLIENLLPSASAISDSGPSIFYQSPVPAAYEPASPSNPLHDS